MKVCLPHRHTRLYQLCLFPIQHSFTFLLFSRRVANSKKKEKKEKNLIFSRLVLPGEVNISSRDPKNAREAYEWIDSHSKYGRPLIYRTLILEHMLRFSWSLQPFIINGFFIRFAGSFETWSQPFNTSI